MTWNYRIVKYADGTGFGLHEVHYDEEGKEVSMTENPVRFASETAEELRDSLIIAKTSAINRPVLEPPKEWATE